MRMTKDSEAGTFEELKGEVEELRALVNTLLTIIMEEADGVQSGTLHQYRTNPSADTRCNQYCTGSGSMLRHMYQVATVLQGIHFCDINLICSTLNSSPSE